jgi:hypothetical protein
MSFSLANSAAIQILDFDGDNFAARARKLMAAGIPFAFDISGEGRDQLAPLIVNGRIVDLGRLAVLPKVRVLAALLSLAEVHNRAVVIEASPDAILFSIGTGLA